MATFSEKLSRLSFSPASLHEKRRVAQIKTLEDAIAEGLTSGEQRFPSCESSIECNGGAMDSLVNDILSKERPSPLILGVAKSKSDDDDRKEIYLHLAIPSSASKNDDDDSDASFDRIVLVPVSSFAEKLAEGFEQQLTSTALCFVADASSGIGTEVLGEIVNTCNAGLVLIKEPAWMTTMAYISEQNLLSKPKIDRILFALCRLEAWRVRKHVGKSRTVVFTLPGQSCTAPLLPHLQKIFPCERHVFVYDGCVDSTSRASRFSNSSSSNNSNNNNPATSPNNNATNNTTPTMSPSLPRSVTATTPISPLTTVRDYPTLLHPLSSIQAATVEAWMSSVDAFLNLKDNERESGYLPFVCRMGYLFADTGRLGNGTIDKSHMALTNVLQYITGSRSRPLRDEVLGAAKIALTKCRGEEKEEAQKCGETVPEGDRVAIEACVFAHRGILLGDKTLLDTVQPKKDWSLKAAKKMTSCACCAPEDESDSEEEVRDTKKDSREGYGTGYASTRGSGGDSFMPNMANSQYVDGKNAFAFDPSKFSGM